MGIIRRAASDLRDLLLFAAVLAAAFWLAWLAADYLRGHTGLLPGHGHAAGDDAGLDACEVCAARGARP